MLMTPPSSLRILGIIVAIASTPAAAIAQEPEPSVSVGQDGTTQPAPAPAPVAPPAAPAAPPAAAPQHWGAPRVQQSDADVPAPVSTSDFDPEARRWGIGYTGLSQVPVGLTGAPNDITVPAIGLRYWFSHTTGVDVGVGVGWTGGSTEFSGGTSTDKNSIFGFILQGGLPMALATHRHVSFQVIPFLAVAHGQTSLGDGASKVDLSGTRIDVGARAGFELFFGFIGIPELALSATVGIQFESRKYSQDSSGMSQSDSTYGISTTVQDNPWNIFGGNVAARYYF